MARPRKVNPTNPSIPRPANVRQSLRRIRAELSLILAAVDDGLQRIESDELQPKGD